MATEPNVQITEPTVETQEKTFTQADVDVLISKRLERERKKYPTDEEMTAFRTWQNDQQTDKDAIATLTGERDTARTELSKAQAQLEQYEHEKLLTAKGVPADDLDYYVFKIGKLVSDRKTFEQAAEEFLKESVQNKVRVDMTARLDGGKTSPTSNDAMNALIRGALK